MNDLNEARNRTIATVARRLAKTTQLDFADALIDAQTAVWLVERRPKQDPVTFGFKGIADQAYGMVLGWVQADDGMMRLRANGRKATRPARSWPLDFDVAASDPAPDEEAEWAEILAEFMDLIRDSIRKVDPSAVWVVDAVENGYRIATDLGEWRRRFGYDVDRGECKRVYDLFYRHSRLVMAVMAEREGEDF
jgi:hypothetical protein